MSIVERVARAISPYAWDDAFWQTPARIGQYDRNQRHAQAVALRQATDAVNALAECAADSPEAIKAAMYWTPTPYEIDTDDSEAYAKMIRAIFAAISVDSQPAL